MEVPSKIVLTYWCWITWVVPEKGPLNGCVWVSYKLTAAVWQLWLNDYVVLISEPKKVKKKAGRKKSSHLKLPAVAAATPIARGAVNPIAPTLPAPPAQAAAYGLKWSKVAGTSALNHGQHAVVLDYAWPMSQVHVSHSTSSLAVSGWCVLTGCWFYCTNPGFGCQRRRSQQSARRVT